MTAETIVIVIILARSAEEVAGYSHAISPEYPDEY